MGLAGRAHLHGQVVLQPRIIDQVELSLRPVDALLGLDDHALHEIAAAGVLLVVELVSVNFFLYI